jgi:hypothetical protein
MSDQRDGVLLLAPLRDVGPEPPPAFSIADAIGQVRNIRRRRVVLAGIAVVVAAVTAVVVPSVVHRGSATYPLAAAHVSATLWPVTKAQADALATGSGANAGPGDQLIAGQVTWTPPPNATDVFVTLYLIDKRTNSPPFYWQPSSTDVSIGSDGWDDVIARRYPWLSMVASRHVAAGDMAFGDELTARASLGSITFVAYFPRSDADFGDLRGHIALAPIDVSDLMLAVVYHDTYGNGGWAYRAVG